MSDEKNTKTAADVYDERLIGTFITVLVIGAFIVISWFGILYFYITSL